jgi:tRNA (guanine37-N1)-methyltransferase
VRIDIVSIFPEYLEPLGLSLVGKAVETGRISVATHDLRDATHDRHRTVDDAPFGGGPGMVMKPEPWGEVLDRLLATAAPGTRIVVPTPSGGRFTQKVAADYAGRGDDLIFACGRYEGIDDRVWQHFRTRVAVDEWTIGDYVLAGGEAATLVMVEAIVRLLPGVLGNDSSAGDDSFAPERGTGVLEGPVFTKPREWRHLGVPEILMSGDHARIAAWRREQARQRTATNRPDLV